MHGLQLPTRPYLLIRMDHHEPHADDASSTTESPGYIADFDLMGEDDNEDPEEDPSKEHELEDDDEDPEEDPNEEHELEDEDTKEEPFKGSDETKPFEEDETALIDAFVAGSPPFLLPPTRPTYDQAPLGYRTAMICMRDDIPEEDMPPWRRFVITAPPPRYDVAESFTAAAARVPRGQYDFVDTVEAGQGLIRSPGSQLEDQLPGLSSQAGEIMPVTRQGTNDSMTPESIQAMIDRAIQRNSTHTQDDASQTSGGGLRRIVQRARVCCYTDFMKRQPLNFKGTKGIVGLFQWLEKMESVFHISGFAVDNQVKFATCTLLGTALTWWNGHVRTLGHDVAYAMTWGTLKKKLTKKYCPKGEIKKLEIKLWNLRVKGNDVAAYTQPWERFKDLLRQCPHHGFSELHQLDTFYNALNPNDQDALDSAVGGNFLDKIPRECLSIIESKSKVRYSRSRVTDVRANTNAPLSSSSYSNSFDLQQIAAALEDKLDIRMNRFEKSLNEMKNSLVTPTAPLKAVTEVFVTCGSNHSYNQCPLTRGRNDFPVFHDNIQQFQTTAVRNFIQNRQNVSNQTRPPGFHQPTQQSNIQNRF
nr:reverse transcriptase domain-containing protein [Tanacetum cinerariifolium]